MKSPADDGPDRLRRCSFVTAVAEFAAASSGSAMPVGADIDSAVPRTGCLEPQRDQSRVSLTTPAPSKLMRQSIGSKWTRLQSGRSTATARQWVFRTQHIAKPANAGRELVPFVLQVAPRNSLGCRSNRVCH